MQAAGIAAHRATDRPPPLSGDTPLPRDTPNTRDASDARDDCCVRSPRPLLYDMAAPTESDASKTRLPSSPRTKENAPTSSYGLRQGALSPMETLAQSVSTIAPTTTPAATIPLVFALAGNGTWLAYLLATAAVLLVGGVHQPIGPVFLFPWIAVHLCIDDSAAVARSSGGMEPAACLHRHRRKRRRRLLSLRKRAARRSDGTQRFDRGSDRDRVRSFHVDRQPRRENFRALDAVHRGRFSAVYSNGRGAGASAPRHSSRPTATATARHDRKRPASRSGDGALQLCRVRERDHAGRRGARSSANHPARRDPERHHRRRFLYDLRLHRSIGLSRRWARLGHQPDARCTCWQELPACPCSAR